MMRPVKSYIHKRTVCSRVTFSSTAYIGPVAVHISLPLVLALDQTTPRKVESPVAAESIVPAKTEASAYPRPPA